MDLEGRVALITGGRRIGAVVADELAGAGCDIAIVYRQSKSEAEQVAMSVGQRGRRGLALQADLRDPDACRSVVNDTAAQLGRLDILVNMASVYHSTPFDQLTVEQWDEQMGVDLRSTWLCARAAVPHMRRAGGGRVINFSDWTAPGGRPRYRDYLPYYVAKAGVKALTESLALELARDGILVNAIAPGPVLPPAEMSDETRLAVERVTPVGRWGGAAEVARLILSLVVSDFITGETIRLDGGRHLL